MSATSPRHAELAAEDAARARCYALIGALFFGPLQRDLGNDIAQGPAPDGDAPLARAWRALQDACRSANYDAARQEYDDLFIGVGQAPVTLYTAHYIAPHGPDRHLVRLREQLAAWGLARGALVGETEDHLSGVCDVMRWLIESGRTADIQRHFFMEFVDPAREPLCNAITKVADFYRAPAAFAGAFLRVEREAFDLM
jgi:TorA maturation chaperone TorD